MNTGGTKQFAAGMPMSGWHALKWNYMGNLTRGAAQFAIGVILARILGPEPFGIVALAWMVLGLGRLFADLGFGAAVVQRKTLSEQELRFIFTCQLGFAVFLTGAGLLCADAIAAYFHRPEAAPVLRALFLLFVIDCPGQASAALLRRSLNFKTVQQISVATYLLGYLVVGIPCAFLGLGAWSLVAAQLTQSLLNSCLLLRAAPIPLMPSLRCDTPDIARFGLKVTAANLSSWSISNLDSAFIGRAFGVVDLGLYGRALNLLNTPMSIIATGFQGVLFAACSRNQEDGARLRRIYLETSAVVALVCMPIFVTAAVIPGTIIVGIYGAKWQAAVPLVTPLALAVLVNALLAISGPILMAANQVGVELRNQLVTVLIFIPLLLVAIQASMIAAAWAVFGTYMLRWTLLSIATLRITGARAADYLAILGIPCAFGVAVAAVAAGADRGFAVLPPFFRLAVVAALTTATLLVLARQFGAGFARKNLHTLVDLDKLPLPLKRFLRS
jgi:O-antigen/teichoic acid export membrane protein